MPYASLKLINKSGRSVIMLRLVVPGNDIKAERPLPSRTAEIAPEARLYNDLIRTLTKVIRDPQIEIRGRKPGERGLDLRDIGLVPIATEVYLFSRDPSKSGVPRGQRLTTFNGTEIVSNIAIMWIRCTPNYNLEGVARFKIVVHEDAMPKRKDLSLSGPIEDAVARIFFAHRQYFSIESAEDLG